MSDFFRFSIQFARPELFARCVNALGRAYPISTLNVAGVNLTEIDCVNALSRAYPISTIIITEKPIDEISCVNALSRAYPISTVPFQKPFKISGFRSHFQGVIVRKF